RDVNAHDARATECESCYAPPLRRQIPRTHRRSRHQHCRNGYLHGEGEEHSSCVAATGVAINPEKEGVKWQYGKRAKWKTAVREQVKIFSFSPFYLFPFLPKEFMETQLQSKPVTVEAKRKILLVEDEQ